MRLLLALFAFLATPMLAGAQAFCKICERIELFDAVKKEVGVQHWPELSRNLKIPLIYFDDSSSFIAFGEASRYSKDTNISMINCPAGLTLQRFSRLGSAPFYMQNKSDYSDTSSPYYFNPTMFCSDAEAMARLVPEFTTTEHWLQLLTHEYFHAFQLSHKELLRYFGKHIRIGEDSLDRLYLKDSTLAHRLKQENAALLAAIGATDKDSTLHYATHFLRLRSDRRKQHFRKTNLAAVEDFWEKMEGPARYVEYYMGLAFPAMTHRLKCDTMFKSFAAFKVDGRLEETEVFVARTEISPAYYYATGFNLCRLLDKLAASYKDKLFTQPALSLGGILTDELKRNR